MLGSAVTDDVAALTDTKSHPAQRGAFLGAYRYLLELGIPPQSIVFMGDSAGGESALMGS